jgi:hypothetical protein
MKTKPFEDNIHYGISSIFWKSYFVYLDKIEQRKERLRQISNTNLAKLLIREDNLESFSKPEWKEAIEKFNSLSLEEKVNYLTTYIFQNKEYTI